MSQIHFVGVFVRLFALYLALTTVHLVATMAFSTEDWFSATSGKFNLAVVTVVTLAVAVMLWAFNLSVARRLFHGSGGDRPLDLGGAEHLEQALFAVAGLWLVCQGLIDGAFWASFLVLMSEPEWASAPLDAKSKSSMFSSAIQLVLGIVLMLRAQGLSRAIAKFRGRE